MRAVVLPRRIHAYMWLLLMVAVAFFFLSYQPGNSRLAWLRTSYSSWRAPFTSEDGLVSLLSLPSSLGGKKNPGPLEIAIVNSVSSHDEVSAALVHAFGKQPGARLRIYQKKQRYRMGDIIDNFSLANNRSVGKWDTFAKVKEADLHVPDILVATTCEFDLPRSAETLKRLLEANRTYLFCVFHHADHWNKNGHVDIAREWARRGRFAFMGLSQRTADMLQNHIDVGWEPEERPPIHAFPPVFPVGLPSPDANAEVVEEVAGQGAGLSLAMQGDYSTGRRDYRGIFQQLSQVASKVQASSSSSSSSSNNSSQVALHVLGNGKPPSVPPEIKDLVIFDENLSYRDFYGLLSRSFAILPAFASDAYFDHKASSTIPTSLMAGAPVVASEALLAAYTYLPREATWVAEPGEQEMATVERVLDGRGELAQKQRSARAACARLIDENTERVREWVAHALARVAESDGREQITVIQEGPGRAES